MTLASINQKKPENTLAELLKSTAMKVLSPGYVTITSEVSGVGLLLKIPLNEDAAPLPQDVFYKTIIYDSLTVPTPSAGLPHFEQSQRVDAYAERVMDVLKKVEVGRSGERNIKFQQLRH